MIRQSPTQYLCVVIDHKMRKGNERGLQLGMIDYIIKDMCQPKKQG